MSPRAWFGTSGFAYDHWRRAYFNNDLDGHAPRDAARLRAMPARRGVRC